MKHVLLGFVAACGLAAGAARAEAPSTKGEPTGRFLIADHAPSAAPAYEPIPLAVTARADGSLRLHGENAERGIGIEATATPGADGGWAMEAEVRNLRGGDRALWLEFRLPLPDGPWRWWETVRTTRMAPATGVVSTALHPLPTVSGPAGTFTLAVPPTHPAAVLGGADADGLWLRWPLGLVPETRPPGAARVAFFVRRSASPWGLRDALAWYYERYAEYYHLPPEQMRKWDHDMLWGRAGDCSRMPPGRRDGPCMAYYNFSGKVRLADEMDGRTEAGFRRVLETARLSLTWYDEDPLRARAIFLNSILHDANGRLSYTPDGKSYKFAMNADPDLLRDREAPNQGRFLLDQIVAHAEAGRIDALHFDTVGRWGRPLNYRREHFAYAAHPLVFDAEGRVGLYNKLSLCEFFAALRVEARRLGLRVEAAGMKPYPVGGGHIPEFGADGRFFTAALIDSGWHEGNFKTLPSDGYALERMYAGRKSYRISSGNLLKRGRPPSEAEIRRALAQNTAWGIGLPICASYMAQPGTPDYDQDYALYARDAALWARYAPVNEALRLAGWEPVTHARMSDESLTCERFGRGAELYFTVWGPSAKRGVRLTIDATALGLDPSTLDIEELIAGIQPEVAFSGAQAALVFDVDPAWVRVFRVRESAAP
ncbi:MAG TPA: hypothetical protein PKE12_05455 [Kiritimatiellia bacterium]|nr:hypothetical protein [Kiritimatiellia bacterium]